MTRLSTLFLLFSLVWLPKPVIGQFITASHPAGYHSTPFLLTLTCSSDSAAVIRYTTDGHEPDSSSSIYDGPLLLDATTAVRAKADMSGSPVLSNTYLLGKKHEFPVAALIFEPADFFDTNTGIYPNYTEGLGARAQFEFFEPDRPAACIKQWVNIEIQGSASASQPQKSLEINARGSLGAETLDWPFFPNLPFDSYKRLVLRNGGQDWMVTQFRDEFVTDLVSNLGEYTPILQLPDLDWQAWRPAVVYLNGQYWGIHNLRERMNRFYVQQHYDLQQADFDLIDNYATAITGDANSWNALFNWLQNHHFQQDSAFAILKQKIDYQNFIDYCALNIFIDNQDWPGNNNRRWRERDPNGHWRWLCKDFDFTLGLFQQSTGGWNTGDASPDALSRLLDSTSSILPNPDWSTLLFRRCWENATFRRDFANRSADFLNTIFHPKHVQDRLYFFQNLYRPEITKHYERWWFANYDTIWLANIERIRAFGDARPAYMLQYMDDALHEVAGLATIALDISPREAGTIHISTLTLDSAQVPRPLTYLANLPVPVQAIAKPGWHFIGWESSVPVQGDSTLFQFNEGPQTLVARFAPDAPVTTHATALPYTTIQPWPNPGSEVLYLQPLPEMTGAMQIALINQTGVSVKTWDLSVGDSALLRFDIRSVPSGLYIFRATAAANKHIWLGKTTIMR